MDLDEVKKNKAIKKGFSVYVLRNDYNWCKAKGVDFNKLMALSIKQLRKVDKNGSD